MANMITEDLESLTGKLIQGPITPIVYTLLKDSPYKEDILNCKDLISKERREKIVSKQNPSNDNDKKVDSRTSFERWLAEHGEPITL